MEGNGAGIGCRPQCAAGRLPLSDTAVSDYNHPWFGGTLEKAAL